MIKFLILFLISINLFAEGIPEKMQTDFVQLGRASSSDPAELFFDVGDGASNPVLSVDKTAKTFDMSKPLRVQGDLSIGNGSPADQSFIVDEGAGANNPELKWDTTENKWKQFDGTTERNIGAGSGGGTGINILGDKNPGAEDGVLNWTYVGTGSFATTVDPAEIFDGEKSFVTDFDVQAETLKSSEETIKQGLMGQSCQARFFYIGGDDSIDITATIRNGNDAIVPGSETKILKVATIWTVVDLGFVCPSESAIGGDSELGNLYLEFEQTGSGDSAIFRHDANHLGSLIGLSEAVLPDLFSAVIGAAGDSQSPRLIISESVANIITCTRPAVGKSLCDYTGLGLTVTPTFTCTVDTDGYTCTYASATNTSVEITTTTNVTGANTDREFSLHITKQGVDAKQSVTVFKSSPRVSENINEFSAKLSTAAPAIVSDENVEWITGNCTRSGTGNQTATCTVSGFTLTPNCNCTVNVTGQANDRVCMYDSSTSTSSSLVFHTTEGDSASSQPFTVSCQKHSADFKFPEQQLILVNQVETSFKNGVTSESCTIINSGTPAIDTGSSLCESWVTGFTDNGTGDITVNYANGPFSKSPNCNVNAIESSANRVCSMFGIPTTSAARITCFNSSTDSGTDLDFVLKCTGAR